MTKQTENNAPEFKLSAENVALVEIVAIAASAVTSLTDKNGKLSAEIKANEAAANSRIVEICASLATLLPVISTFSGYRAVRATFIPAYIEDRECSVNAADAQWSRICKMFADSKQGNGWAIPLSDDPESVAKRTKRAEKDAEKKAAAEKAAAEKAAAEKAAAEKAAEIEKLVAGGKNAVDLAIASGSPYAAEAAAELTKATIAAEVEAKAAQHRKIRQGLADSWDKSPAALVAFIAENVPDVAAAFAKPKNTRTK